MMRLKTSAAYWAGHIQSRAESDAPTLLLCLLLALGIWRMSPPAEQPLALKITFFDGANSARYEVIDPADFDADVLLEVHHQFYGLAARTNANTDEEQ